MPKMGESIIEAQIIKWRKQPGERVEFEEMVLDIATDKVDSEVPSPVAGVLENILFKNGDTVPVGTVIAIIETEPVTLTAPEPVTPVQTAIPEPAAAEVQPVAAETIPVAQNNIPASVTAAPIAAAELTGAVANPALLAALLPEPQPGRFYSPLVTNIARQEGISNDELDRIAGTGQDGRVTKQDILRYVALRKEAQTATVVTAPVVETTVIAAPVPETTVIAAPVAETPVATAPVPETPVASAPVPETTVATAPVTETPVVTAPVPETTVATAPVAETPVVTAPVAETPVVTAPVAETPVVTAPVAETPVVKETPKTEEITVSKPQVYRLVSETTGPVVRKREFVFNGEFEIIEMDRMRKLIADAMSYSKHISPHVTSFVEADVTNLVQWRDRIKDTFEKKYNVKLTYTPIFLSAVCRALRDFPLVNSSVDADKIIVRKDINISLAVALPSGNLIVPTIRNADRLSLAGMAAAVNDLTERARTNKLRPEDITDGTYTVSNVGTFGNVMGTPVIMQPQVAVLALGAIKKKPAVIETPNGEFIGIRQLMYLSHSYDHRIIDGALGGSFVRRVADYLESWEIEDEV